MKRVVLCTAHKPCPFEDSGNPIDGTIVDDNLRLQHKIDELRKDNAEQYETYNRELEKLRIGLRADLDKADAEKAQLLDSLKQAMDERNKNEGEMVAEIESLTKERDALKAENAKWLSHEIDNEIQVAKLRGDCDLLRNTIDQLMAKLREQNNNDIIADAVKSLLRREDVRLILRVVHQAVFPGPKTMATNQTALETIVGANERQK
jgi:chromosome segregation ATPase